MKTLAKHARRLGNTPIDLVNDKECLVCNFLKYLGYNSPTTENVKNRFLYIAYGTDDNKYAFQTCKAFDSLVLKLDRSLPASTIFKAIKMLMRQVSINKIAEDIKTIETKLLPLG